MRHHVERSHWRLVGRPSELCNSGVDSLMRKGLLQMGKPKDLFDKIIRTFQARTEPENSIQTYHRHPPGQVFARATPEVVRIVETYAYRQVISRNHELSSDPAQDPKGDITITVPLDGDHFFSREAQSDIAGQLPPIAPQPTSALVGHVVLANSRRSNFHGVGNRNGDVMSIPIWVPVSGPGIPQGYDHLIADRASRVLTHEYKPDPTRPEIMPVTVTIELRDPDSADFLEISDLSSADPETAAAKLRTQRAFQPYLELRVKVEAQVIGENLTDRPEVSVSIEWPSVTSPSFFSLRVSGKRHPLRYNPRTRRIEWRNISLAPVERKGAKQAKDKDVAKDDDEAEHKVAGVERHDTQDENGPEPEVDEDDNAESDAGPDADELDEDADDADGGAGSDEDEADDGYERDGQVFAIHTYASPAMSLLIKQPGELYNEKELKATVDVRIPRLLSGMEARLYGGTGRRTKDYAPEVASEVSTQVRVILADAFADRTVSSYQHLHFDEVLLNAARVEDFKNALLAEGFEYYHERVVRADPVVLLLFYRKREGPDYLNLVYLLESTRYKTRRETTIGGEKFTTSLDSGDLQVYGYGTLRRSSREITSAMNRLHQVLRTQFGHVRVRR